MANRKKSLSDEIRSLKKQIEVRQRKLKELEDFQDAKNDEKALLNGFKALSKDERKAVLKAIKSPNKTTKKAK